MSTDRLKHDLRRLTRPDPSAAALPPTHQPKAIPAGRAMGSGPGDDTAGIASPLTETAFEDRIYYSTEDVITTPDGVYVATVQRLQRISMTDANDALVEMVFAEPAT